MDIRITNREAWNRQVEQGNPWTRPVGSDEVAAARKGKWQVVLTPTIPVPATWFPALKGAEVLCLASGGGQQGPILAAAGATVTVFDNSPRQLEQDRMVAKRDGLDLRTIEGDMRDLSCFDDSTFDLIFHPVSNTFVPDVEPVWREAHRVLREGGHLLAGFDHPVTHLFDDDAYMRGELVVSHTLPYSEADSLTAEGLARKKQEGTPLEFGHTLDAQIAGQLRAGFVLVDLFEDRYAPEENDLLGRYTATFIATRARKESRR